VAERRVTIPRLKNPVAVKWYVGTVLACLVMIGYLAATQPENRIFAVPALAVVLLPLLLFARRQWLDPKAGTVGQTLLWSCRSSIRLSSDLPVSLIDSGNGILQLSLGRFPKRIFLPLLRLDVYDHGSQEPAVLRMLAEQIMWRVPVKREIADRLNRQADHVEAGGAPDSSPLAAFLVEHTVNPLPGRVRRHG